MAVMQPAIGYLFRVGIDGVDLGAFTKVEGLSASYQVMEVKEGGQNGFVHKLPGRIEFQNVKFSRPVDTTSAMLAKWFSSFQPALDPGGQIQPTTAAIHALNASHEPVAAWVLGGVFPVSYSGPTFQAGNGTVLTETLELAHTGFLDPTAVLA